MNRPNLHLMHLPSDVRPDELDWDDSISAPETKAINTALVPTQQGRENRKAKAADTSNSTNHTTTVEITNQSHTPQAAH